MTTKVFIFYFIQAFVVLRCLLKKGEKTRQGQEILTKIEFHLDQ
jgi:phage-related protein